MTEKVELKLASSRQSTQTEVEDEPKREYWSSRLAFYFATAGAAIGFGNVWRFPGLSVQYGGGAFFIPYFLALLFIGIPLTILEIGFGQYFQTGDIGVFGGFHRRLRGVGVCSMVCGFIVSSYYIVLIGWVVNAFFASWNPNAPWGNPDVTGDEAVTYFYNEIIGMETVVSEDLRPSRVVGKNVGYTALVWFAIFLGTFFGLKTTGRLTYFTMGLPILLLILFLGRAITLPGASEGVHAYIGEWDLSVLRTKGEVWSVACSQVFFSISLTFGILTSYGSHCKRNEPAVLNSCVIVASNSMFSIVTGFAVFCALGHLAYINGTSVTDIPYAGFSLVFGTWPVVLGSLPGGIHWVRLLFFDLFLLGVDSAFSFVESLLTVLQDTEYFQHVPRRVLLAGCIIPNFLCSILYCTDSGLYFLDVIDFYVNFVMLLVGFLEAFGASWANGIIDLYKSIGVKATLSYMGANFIPVLVACGLWFSGDSNSTKVWSGFMALFVGSFIGLLVTHFYLMRQMRRFPERWKSVKSIWWECAFGNICRLRDRIQPVIGPIPFIWVILIKNFVPHVLIVLFLNLCAAENGAGNYGNYEIRPYQVLGLLTFIFAIFLFFIGLLVPEIYEPFALPQIKDYSNKDLEEHLFGTDEEEASSSKSSKKSFASLTMDENEEHGGPTNITLIKSVKSLDSDSL